MSRFWFPTRRRIERWLDLRRRCLSLTMISALSKHIADLMDDDDARASASAASMLRAREFDWSKTAAQTLELIEEAVAAARPRMRSG